MTVGILDAVRTPGTLFRGGKFSVTCAAFLLCAVVSAQDEQEKSTPDQFPALERHERALQKRQQRAVQQRRNQVFNRTREKVAAALRNPDLDKRIIDLLEADKQVQTLLAEKSTRRLLAFRRYIWKQIRGVPPPPRYVNSAGLELRLHEIAGGERFYVSTPVTREFLNSFLNGHGHTSPDSALTTHQGTTETGQSIATGVTRNLAQAYCGWLTETAGHEYRLPTFRQAEATGNLPVAIWTRTTWEYENRQTADLCRRSGLRLWTLYDPRERLAAGRAVGELPFANYKSLGFVITTTTRTAIQNRLQRLRKRVQQ